jgi:dTDP-glucose 4,6-dehydratase
MVQEKGRLFETYNIGGHNEKQNIEIVNIIIEKHFRKCFRFGS